jgi:hypothetical protein
MKTKEIYIIDNLIINIDKYLYESDEMFAFRVNYIYNKYIELNKDIKNIEKIINESIIESNIKYLKVKY